MKAIVATVVNIMLKPTKSTTAEADSMLEKPLCAEKNGWSKTKTLRNVRAYSHGITNTAIT